MGCCSSGQKEPKSNKTSDKRFDRLESDVKSEVMIDQSKRAVKIDSEAIYIDEYDVVTYANPPASFREPQDDDT